MSFKELLHRYKEGIATEEEGKIVEKELEKYESIEEYLADDLFNQYFEKDDTREEIPVNNEAETKNIKKAVNRRLGKVVLISVVAVVALYIGIFYGVSNIVDLMYYDPTAVTQPKEDKYQSSDFYYDMKAYISLNMPGYSIHSFTFEEPKGFGNYEVSYALRDLFNKNNQRHFINLSRGKFTYAIDGIFSRENRFGLFEGFQRIGYDFTEENNENEQTLIDREIQRKNEETLRYLKELNPLSYISMSIVFNEDLTMEEFYEMSEKHPPLNFKWVGIRTVKPGTQYKNLIGFNPRYNDEASSPLRPDPEKYPIFSLDSQDIREAIDISDKDYPEITSEAYKIHFRSRLKYLRDREEFIEIFDYTSYMTGFYNKALEYIDEYGVKTYGVLVFGRAEEFLEHIDEIPYDSLYINKVLPTKPNIYYN